jgi:hypothetical protein
MLFPLKVIQVFINRPTSGESASLPQYLIYFHSSQCRLIPYLHQRPICFKANSIHSSIVAILELIRGAQYLIVSNKGRSQWYEIINGTRSIGKPQVSPLRFLNPSAVIRYLICVYASHFFVYPLVATSADSVPSSSLVRITIAPIGTTFGNLQWRRY